jgi:hypothetical protein
LIAAISISITRRILPFEHAARDRAHHALEVDLNHIMASVCLSSIGSNSIPQRAAEVPIDPANAKRRGSSTTVTLCAL